MNALEWEVFGHTADRIRDGLSRHVRRVAPHREHALRQVSVDPTTLTTDRPCCGPTARAMALVRDLWIAAEVDR